MDNKILDELRRRDADWQQRADNWITIAEEHAGEPLTLEVQTAVRQNLYGQAATEIERLMNANRSILKRAQTAERRLREATK